MAEPWLSRCHLQTQDVFKSEVTLPQSAANATSRFCQNSFRCRAFHLSNDDKIAEHHNVNQSHFIPISINSQRLKTQPQMHTLLLLTLMGFMQVQWNNKDHVIRSGLTKCRQQRSWSMFA
jgi:hypothetical protein